MKRNKRLIMVLVVSITTATLITYGSIEITKPGGLVRKKYAKKYGFKEEREVEKNYEELVQVALNGRNDILGAGLFCESVKLTEEYTDEYVGYAEFNNKEKTYIKVTIDDGELSYDVELPIVPRIQASTLSDYNYTTIGKAFNTFFAKPKWKLNTAKNGTSFVVFSGQLKDDLEIIDSEEIERRVTLVLMGQRGGDLEKGWNWKKGETVVIKFLLDHDCSSFHLWSIEREDGKKLRNNDFEEKPYISRFLEEVYGIKL